MKTNLAIFIVLLCGFNICNVECVVRPLTKDWVLSIKEGVYPANVPSTFIDDLIQNNVLPRDFYFRDNFLEAYKY